MCAADLYAPHSKVANTLFAVLNVYEMVAPRFVRKVALKRAYNLVKMEDENTSYQVSGWSFTSAARLLTSFDFRA